MPGITTISMFFGDVMKWNTPNNIHILHKVTKMLNQVKTTILEIDNNLLRHENEWSSHQMKATHVKLKDNIGKLRSLFKCEIATSIYLIKSKENGKLFDCFYEVISHRRYQPNIAIEKHATLLRISHGAFIIFLFLMLVPMAYYIDS